MNRKVWKIVFIIMFAIMLIFAFNKKIKAYTLEEVKAWENDSAAGVGSRAGKTDVAKATWYDEGEKKQTNSKRIDRDEEEDIYINIDKADYEQDVVIECGAVFYAGNYHQIDIQIVEGSTALKTLDCYFDANGGGEVFSGFSFPILDNNKIIGYIENVHCDTKAGLIDGDPVLVFNVRFVKNSWNGERYFNIIAKPQDGGNINDNNYAQWNIKINKKISQVYLQQQREEKVSQISGQRILLEETNNLDCVNKTILNGNILKVLSATETPYIQWKGDGKPEAKRKEYYNKQFTQFEKMKGKIEKIKATETEDNLDNEKLTEQDKKIIKELNLTKKRYTYKIKGKVYQARSGAYQYDSDSKGNTIYALMLIGIDNDSAKVVYYIKYAENEEETNEIIEELESKLDDREDELFEQLSFIVDTGNEREKQENYKNVLDDINHYTPEKEAESTAANKAVGSIIGVITSIGIIVSVLVPAIVGVKYMIASASEKADYKKDMIPYLIGAVLLFGISLVVKILQEFGNSFNS